VSLESSIFVDTSGWVSLIGEDETFHDEITAIYQEAMRQRCRLITTNYIVTEVVALLTNRPIVPRQRMIAFVDALKAAPHVQIEFVDRAIDDVAWVRIKERSERDWSLVDASSFILMEQFNVIQALTLDHHFEQAGFIRLPTP
jgi:predicted nucleic acid-binding protein